MAELRSVVAGNIRAQRARLNLRQADLMTPLNLSQSATSALENGARELTLTEALILCRVLRMPFAKLVEGADVADFQL